MSTTYTLNGAKVGVRLSTPIQHNWKLTQVLITIPLLSVGRYLTIHHPVCGDNGEHYDTFREWLDMMQANSIIVFE